MNCYTSGDFWIERGEYGYHHGLSWALWGTVTDERGTCKMVLGTDKTLKRLQRNALARYGIPLDSWKKEKIQVQLAEPLTDHTGAEPKRLEVHLAQLESVEAASDSPEECLVVIRVMNHHARLLAPLLFTKVDLAVTESPK